MTGTISTLCHKRKEVKPAQRNVSVSGWLECELDVIWSSNLGLRGVDDGSMEDERSWVPDDCGIISGLGLFNPFVITEVHTYTAQVNRYIHTHIGTHTPTQS